MASKSRSREARKKRTSDQIVDLGIFNIPDVDMIDNFDDESEEDDSVLELELQNLLSGTSTSRPARPKKKVMSPVDIEKLATECLIEPDENEEEEGNLSMDEDLLNELQRITVNTNSDKEVNIEKEIEENELPAEVPNEPIVKPMISLLEERLGLYNEAIIAAKVIGDNSKLHRYGRAVKTLEELLKSARSGKDICEEDIPPVVNIPKEKFPPAPNMSVNENLTVRRDQYKKAALQAKRAGDKAAALNYLKISKSLDAAVEAVKSGQPVDLTNIPPPPPENLESTTKHIKEGEQKTLDESQASLSLEAAALSAANEPEDHAMFEAPPAPATVIEALQQRLEKYISTKQAAEAEGNSGKIRRLQRIIKLYESAIKDYESGKSVDFDSLPSPPGFAPIPVNNQQTKPAPLPSADGRKLTESEKASVPISGKPGKEPQQPETQKSTLIQRKPKVQRTNTSIIDKQLEFLLERQKMFRQAALEAKRNGDIQQAKEYLRMSKGFDSMIDATRCGLPIDASTIPTPPQMESDFVVVDILQCHEDNIGNHSELLEKLEKDLTHQIEICSQNKEHFLRLGDVLSASKFERLCLESRKDLFAIQHLKKSGGSVPQFHYETRLFSIVKCHTDLGDNDLEVTVKRGINLPGKPDDLDSYVKLEFPIPSDAPQRVKTNVVRDTNNPSFEEEFKFEFNRKSRSHLRQFKRQALKLEVWAKGGFLRSDALLGTVCVKLVDLESKCVIHDCFNLMDGRKACGGKLEVKIRMREPLLVKQVEEVREKWLVVGS